MPEMPTLSNDEIIHCIFVDAMPGIADWSSLVNFHAEIDPEVGRYEPDLLGFGADIIDTEDGGEFFIDRAVIERGLALGAVEWRDRLAWSTEPPPAYGGDEYPLDGWDYDAGDADMIVQLGLFGEVKYG